MLPPDSVPTRSSGRALIRKRPISSTALRRIAPWSRPRGPVKSAIEVMPPRVDSRLAFYKDGYHLLLRDKDGRTVAADVAAWIANHWGAFAK